MAVTKIADVIVPEIFAPYVQQMTEEKTRLIQSGIMPILGEINEKLQGGGLTFQVPGWLDLGNDAENIISDDESTDSVPKKTGTYQETMVRLNRHQSWSAMRLTRQLAGSDPMQSIASRVSDYWARRKQALAIACLTGVFADNDAVPAGDDTHAQGDLTVDISGGSYSAGITDFHAEAVIDAQGTMGDSESKITAIMMHSIIYARAKKNNLIDMVSDSANPLAAKIPYFFDMEVIVDDGMPNPSAPAPATTGAGIYHTWLLGPGLLGHGQIESDTPVAIERKESAGNGGGQDILHNRIITCVHPAGHRYIGASPDGGPDNTSSTNMLANAGSWSRTVAERKMIPLCRLISRES